MRILVVLGHPAKGSFNHAIAETVVEALRQNGHEVVSHDLYKEKFDAILPAWEISKENKTDPHIEKHCKDLIEAEGIVIIHPNWWGQPPAILKGWVDRVFRPGVAYKFIEGDNGEGVPVGLLKARAAIVFNTSNTPFERESSVFGDPLETLWKNCIFGLCGVNKFYRRTFSVVVTSSLPERKNWLAEAEQLITSLFP